MRLGTNEILYINALESITGAKARGCIVEGNNVSYLVDSANIGKAIGKKGANIQAVKTKTGKNISVFEYAENAEDFVKKALGSVRIESIKHDNASNALFVNLAHGSRNALSNDFGKIKRIKEVLKKGYNIEDLKIR
jgi:N utilization substance protein A